LTLLVGRQEGHLACKNWCWFVDGDDLSGSFHVIATVVTTTFIVFNSSEIQNGHILVLANPGPPGKMVVKLVRKKVRETELFHLVKLIIIFCL